MQRARMGAGERIMRILLVEDHADTLEVLGAMLRKLGHEITTATTLADARRHCEQDEFDLLISDIGLPDGDGWELGALATQRGLKAIALTGYGMAADIASSR